MRQLKKDVWPYSTSIKYLDYNNVTEIEDWCTEKFGWRFTYWYSYGDYCDKCRTYAFKDEAALLVFKLKWYKG